MADNNSVSYDNTSGASTGISGGNDNAGGSAGIGIETGQQASAGGGWTVITSQEISTPRT